MSLKNPRSDSRWWIYLLQDPRYHEVERSIRYVGISTAPDIRYKDHLEEACSGLRTHKCNWIRSLLEVGLDPMLVLVESGQGPSWESCEQFYIKFYRDEVGCNLTNMTAGGDGTLGRRLSEETRLKMSLMKKGLPGRKPTEETRRNMSHSARCKPRVSTETRLKLSQKSTAVWSKRKMEISING